MKNYANGLAQRIIESMGIKEVVSDETINSPAFKNWFNGSKVVDSNGKPMPVYHGTGRPDRVGTRFRKSRATAGPMSYFSENPEVSSGYASSKPDTSHEVENYADWFMVKIGRTKVNIIQAWYLLPEQEKIRMAKLAPKVCENDDGQGDIIFDENNKRGNGGYYPERYRGNVLQALFEAWVAAGPLFNEEERFLDVLKLAGMTTPVIFEHPNVTYPFVYQVFLSIKHPLDTSNIPKDVIESLQKIGKRIKTNSNSSSYYDTWNKKNKNAAEWLHDLMNDGHPFTVVPDWVTKTLKAYGYDGIKDIGGKMSGENHTVWIPFEENQVKSAISNKNFDANSSNILK
jgi:hypothetical protein